MAKAGLELAVLDAALRAEGRPLGEYLGAVRDRVPSGVSVGIQRDPATLVEVVRGYLDEGYVRIKIKIKPGRDVAETAAVRDAFGGIPLQVDANSAYTLADIDTLAELDRFDLLLIEQPLQEDDIVDHATLARHLRTPVCLDESIVSHKAAADALALGAASVINIKAGRVGGYLEAVAHPRPVPGCRRSRCGAAACSRPASAAPPTPRSRRCRASRCRATCRRRAGSTTATSSPSPPCSRTGTCACRPATGSASRSTRSRSRTSPSRARSCGGRRAEHAAAARARELRRARGAGGDAADLRGSRPRPHIQPESRHRADRCLARRRAAAPEPAAPSELPAGVEVELFQLRSDVAERGAQVRVINDSDTDLVVTSLTFADDWFAGEAVRDRVSTVPAGRTVDLRFALPESACEDEPDAASRTSRVTLELEGGGSATVDVADPLGFTTLIHEKECLRHDLARVATLEWTAFTPSAAPLPAELELSITPAGERRGRRAGRGPDDQSAAVRRRNRPRSHSRCPSRGRMPPPRCPCRSCPCAATRTPCMEDKRGTVFDVLVEVDGASGVVEVAAPEAMRGEILRWVADWCGFGPG